MRFPAFIPCLATALALFIAPQGASAFHPVALEGIDSTCLENPLRGCLVLTAGFLNADDGPDDGEPFIAWQTQMGFTYKDGVTGGLVLFAHGAEGWSVLDSGIGGEFHMPSLAEGRLLHVPGYTGGTGAYNIDRLYLLDPVGAGWRPVAMHDWLRTIDQMLPVGLEIWKGVDYDLRRPWMGLFARTPLWRASDGNCCATGGEAIITLEIEDHRLVATGVRYLPPEE